MDLKNEISALLTELDNEFDPILSSVVDINQYSEKILKSASIFIYHDAGKLSGFIAFYCNSRTTGIAYMSMLAISVLNRGTGLAANLIQGSIDVLKKKGFKTYSLEVYKSNIKALKLYEKFGFKRITETDKSYIMKLTLS